MIDLKIQVQKDGRSRSKALIKAIETENIDDFEAAADVHESCIEMQLLWDTLHQDKIGVTPSGCYSKSFLKLDRYTLSYRSARLFSKNRPQVLEFYLPCCGKARAFSKSGVGLFSRRGIIHSFK